MSEPKTKVAIPDIAKIAEDAAKAFKGDMDDLERGIGMLYVAKVYGWRVLYLGNSPAYIRKCEKWLGVVFKEQFPDETTLSRRSLAFRMLKGVTNFWKAVKGEIPNIRSSELSH